MGIPLVLENKNRSFFEKENNHFSKEKKKEKTEIEKK